MCVLPAAVGPAEIVSSPDGTVRPRRRSAGLRGEGQSGHMMYLRAEDLETSNEHIREFIVESTPGEGEAATYGSVREP